MPVIPRYCSLLNLSLILNMRKQPLIPCRDPLIRHCCFQCSIGIHRQSHYTTEAGIAYLTGAKCSVVAYTSIAAPLGT